MYQWRVTKYNPRFRNSRGEYPVEEWSSVSEIGKVFKGHRLELDEYLIIEEHYVATAMRFLKESGLSSLVVKELECSMSMPSITKELGLDNLLFQSSELHEELRLSEQEISRVCRLNLRNLLWCKLEENNKFFIHFGYDYYMYIGSISPCHDSVLYGSELGLFVESMRSPYFNPVGVALSETKSFQSTEIA